jgi:hypothetical protein
MWLLRNQGSSLWRVLTRAVAKCSRSGSPSESSVTFGIGSPQPCVNMWQLRFEAVAVLGNSATSGFRARCDAAMLLLVAQPGWRLLTRCAGRSVSVSLAMPWLVSIGPAAARWLSVSFSGARFMPQPHWPREHVLVLGGMTARPWQLSTTWPHPQGDAGGPSGSSLGRCRRYRSPRHALAGDPILSIRWSGTSIIWSQGWCLEDAPSSSMATCRRVGQG